MSLLITPASCLYAISLDEGNEVYELGHMVFEEQEDPEEQLRFFIRNFALDRKSFHKALALVLEDDLSLIPSAFYSEKEQLAHLQLLKGDIRGKHLQHGSSADAAVVYALSPGLRQLLENTFTGIRIRHSAEANLALFMSHRAFMTCNAAMLLYEKRVEIMLRKEDQLLYYNVFKWSSSEDLLYYLLFAMEQLSVDPARTRLAFGGEVALDKEPVQTLQRYVMELLPLRSMAPLKLQHELKSLPGHHYFTLLNQHLCA